MSVARKESVQTATWIACSAVATLLGMLSPAVADPYFTLKTTVTITGNPLNSFDVSWVDPEQHAYLLSDRSNKAVDVVNTVNKTQSKLAAGRFAGSVPTCAVSNACDGPNGVLSFYNPASGKHEVWAADGPTSACAGRQTPPFTTACSTVKVIDLYSGAVLHSIPTGGQYRAGELCYDPVDHLIQIVNDSDQPSPYINFVSTEGPNAYAVVKQIKFDGAPGDGPRATNGIEQCTWNPRNGLIYLNVPEVNGNGKDITDGRTVLIDPRRMQIVAQFDIPVAQCAGPRGIAIGPAPQIMLGCNAKGLPDTGIGSSETGTGPQNTAVLDENSGRLIALLPNQGGNDEVWFNPAKGIYFLAEGQNSAQAQLGIVSSFPIIKVLQDVPVAKSGLSHAHSVAADPISGEVYFPIPGNLGGTATDVPNPCGSDAPQGCVAIYESQWNN
jgi:hypothetical protein